NIAEFVAAAGANYVARWTTYHVFPLMESIQKAMTKDGFSFVEILSQCHTNYGKRVGMPEPEDFLKYYKENSVNTLKAKDMSEEELEGKILVGKFVERDRKEFTTILDEMNEELVR
ncbi:MAG: 2-oxoacid:ferredoxin oxidoreductase subunit beta, partial [Thermoplasmata archaeon]|nr:2-oxoacid:ferredoxin oxidoreductase subunit beta [Thermoplasmata archaeon]